jgi:hypothetical protein
MAPCILDAGPRCHVGNYYGAGGDGAVQWNHSAMVAGAVKKGQFVKFFETRFILC